MPIIKNINQAKSSKYNKSRIIALDFGTRKFGIALSDPTLTIATLLLTTKEPFSTQTLTI